MPSNIAIKNYMDPQPAKVHCGDDLSTVIKVLSEHRVSGTAVVDDQDKVIGFVSEQDCIKQLLLSSYHCDKPARVNEVMRKDVAQVGPEDSIIELASQMDSNKPKVYPVVSGGKLIGSIDRRRVLQALSENQQHCNVR